MHLRKALQGLAASGHPFRVSFRATAQARSPCSCRKCVPFAELEPRNPSSYMNNKIFTLEAVDDFFINATKTTCTAVVFREFTAGKNTRSVWMTPDGRTGSADALLDSMIDGIPQEHGTWPALDEIPMLESHLADETLIDSLMFESVWLHAQSRADRSLVHRWPHR